jgi:hypothetical protein
MNKNMGSREEIHGSPVLIEDFEECLQPRMAGHKGIESAAAVEYVSYIVVPDSLRTCSTVLSENGMIVSIMTKESKKEIFNQYRCDRSPFINTIQDNTPPTVTK